MMAKNGIEGRWTCDAAAMGRYPKKDEKSESVPDVFCEYSRPLKCNRKAAENPCLNQDNYFPYRRYQDFLRVRNEIERISRLEAIVAGQDIPDLATCTDEDFKSEFSGMYGSLDEDSVKFEKLFRNYKAGRLEEFEEWMKEEESIRKGNYQGWSRVLRKPDLNKEFTAQELTLFGSVAAGPACGKDWFMLPRKMLSVEEIGALKPKSIKLSSFDPDLSNCLGSRVIPPQAISRDDRGVSEKLAVNIHELMARFPCGITAKGFFLEYKRIHGYTPDYQNLGYKNLIEFLVDLDHVVFTQGNGPNNDFMIYPTYAENFICTPMDTLWRIYHKLIVILQFFDGIAKTDQLVNFFQELYHIELPYLSWGFCSVDEFVVYLVENVKWRNDFYVVENTSTVGGNHADQSVAGHYVIAVTPQRRKALDDLRKVGSCSKAYHSQSIRRKEGPAIPSQFVNLGFKIPHESDSVSQNTEQECVVVYFYSPNDFEIAGVRSWVTLNQFYKKWNSVYRSLKDNNGNWRNASADPKSLQAGLLLVVFNEESSDYIRAQYVKPTDKPRMHRVRLIDEGGCITVHEENIYYMLKSVFNDLKPLVVRANLRNVQSPRYGSLWSEEVLDFAYNIMCPEERSQRFIVKYMTFENSERKWLVTLKMNDRKKVTQDVGQNIMNFCHRIGPQASYRWDPDRAPSEVVQLGKIPHQNPNSESPNTYSNLRTIPSRNNSKRMINGSAEQNWRTSNNSTVSNMHGFKMQNKFINQQHHRSYADAASNSSSWRCKPVSTSRCNDLNSFPTLPEAHSQSLKRAYRKKPNYTYTKTSYVSTVTSDQRK